MSLYNMMYGINPAAPLLLAMLGLLDPMKIPRFRDVFVKDDCIMIYTRTGGGNRPSYVAENDWLRNLPGYVRDYDDEFDSTFAKFLYRADKFKDELKEIHEATGERSPEKLRKDAMQALNDPKNPRHHEMLRRLQPLAAKMAAFFDDKKPGDGPTIIEV